MLVPFGPLSPFLDLCLCITAIAPRAARSAPPKTPPTAPPTTAALSVGQEAFPVRLLFKVTFDSQAAAVGVVAAVPEGAVVTVFGSGMKRPPRSTSTWAKALSQQFLWSFASRQQ